MHPDEPSQTAVRVALVRAIESLRGENRRICSDPYARYFLDGPMRRIYASWLQRKLYLLKSHHFMPGVIGSVILRTRFIDDYLRLSIADGIEQLVILGAGYDTRAFRIEALCDDIVVFEVDHPATQQRKMAIAKKEIGKLPAAAVYVPVRFNRDPMDDRLDRAGYRREARTLFIWEGVTYYISPQAVDRTLRFVTRQSPAGSAIVFDYFPPSVANGTCQLKEARAMRELFARLGEGITFGIEPHNIEAFLSARGFDRVCNYTFQDLKKRYQRKRGWKRKPSELFSIVQATVGNRNDRNKQVMEPDLNRSLAERRP